MGEIEELKAKLGEIEKAIERLEENLLLHSIPEIEGSPGIVVDEAVAKATPCTCYAIDGTEMCFSRGIIGTLSPAQREAYCVAGKTIKEEGIVRRVKKFKEAVGVCKTEIEKFPKGERLEPWLACMGREARKRGIEL